MTICTLAFLRIKNSRCATLRNHKLPWMIYQYSSPQKCVLTIFINTISAFTLPPSIDHKFNLWPFRTFQYIISIDSQFFQWYIVALLYSFQCLSINLICWSFLSEEAWFFLCLPRNYTVIFTPDFYCLRSNQKDFFLIISYL